MSKMIIAEDENLISDFLRNNIDWSELGITEVFTCTNGEEAISLIGKHKVDIVLTDINMPKMSGLELVKRAKLLFGNVKFVIISGYDDFHLVKESFKLGASDYILKSELEPRELKKIVATALEKKTDSNSSDLRSVYLMKETRLKELLWGSKSLTEEDSKYNFHFGFHSFCVVVFKILNFDYILRNDWDGESELLKYGLTNLINEMLDGFDFGEAVFGNNNEIVFIFSLLKGKTKEDIIKITDDIKKNISLYFNFDFRIGISSKYPADEPKALYGTAKKAAEYCFVRNTFLADYDEITKESKAPLNDRAKLIKQFEKYVFNYNFMRIINDFEKFTLDSAPLSSFKEVIEMYRSYFDVLNVLIVQHSWLSGLRINHEHIISTGTLKELNVYLREVLEKLHQSFSNDDSVVAKVKKYIDDNYHKNISTDSISADFCIDSRKLSREFSKLYDVTLPKYIMDVRMKCAMQLITTSDFLLYEIAEMVGYNNYESFSRAFYGYWGQWPKKVKSND